MCILCDVHICFYDLNFIKFTLLAWFLFINYEIQVNCHPHCLRHRHDNVYAMPHLKHDCDLEHLFLRYYTNLYHL